MASIQLSRLGKRYGDNDIIRNLNLDVKDGEFMVFVGPSGCGKSTTLRMIAGLETVSGGEIRIGERIVNDVHPKDRDIAMVFQSYALYPHMTVFDNIAFGLKIRGFAMDDIRRRVTDAATTLGLESFLERKPKALSGGQRQRVALGRAIVRNPSVFLFDEPLSNLDAELRVLMRSEISKLQRRLSTTTVYVTHDQVEAMTMGHRIAVLSTCKEGASQESNLMQCGSPMDLYDRPDNIFTARFIGTPRMNMLTARLSDDGLDIELLDQRLPVPAQFKEAALKRRGDKVMVGIRPEHLGVAHEVDWADMRTLTGEVEIVEPLGHEVNLHLRLGEQLVVGIVRSHAGLPAPGERFSLRLKCEAVHLFDPASEQRLR